MKYSDSSAVVPLLTKDAATDRMQAVYREDSVCLDARLALALGGEGFNVFGG